MLATTPSNRNDWSPYPATRKRRLDMRVNGLIISYRNGMNVFKGPPVTNYPVGDLLCRIFQGETLYNITQILRNCIDGCLTKDDPLTQDKIEDAEYYILRVLLYDDFKPA